jgi:hypothetical protein
VFYCNYLSGMLFINMKDTCIVLLLRSVSVEPILPAGDTEIVVSNSFV